MDCRPEGFATWHENFGLSLGFGANETCILQSRKQNHQSDANSTVATTTAATTTTMTSTVLLLLLMLPMLLTTTPITSTIYYSPDLLFTVHPLLLFPIHVFLLPLLFTINYLLRLLLFY